LIYTEEEIMLKMFKRTIVLVAPIVLIPWAVAWQPGAAYASCGGEGYFTDGGYARPGTWYYYGVANASPNTSGTLHVVRNGGPDEVTPGWIQTDSNGDAQKGPWTAEADETAIGYIEWSNSCSTNTATHINDVTNPTIDQINQTGGTGIPIPPAFSGTASDAMWGTGFNFYAYSFVKAAFRDNSTAKYYNGSSYSSSNPTYRNGTASPRVGMNVTWQIPPPPPTAHLRTHNYSWCAVINDYFYTSAPPVCININQPSNGM
jgi:hypothetical protein